MLSVGGDSQMKKISLIILIIGGSLCIIGGFLFNLFSTQNENSTNSTPVPTETPGEAESLQNWLSSSTRKELLDIMTQYGEIVKKDRESKTYEMLYPVMLTLDYLQENYQLDVSMFNTDKVKCPESNTGLDFNQDENGEISFEVYIDSCELIG